MPISMDYSVSHTFNCNPWDFFMLCLKLIRELIVILRYLNNPEHNRINQEIIVFYFLLGFTFCMADYKLQIRFYLFQIVRIVLIIIHKS